LKIVYKFSKIKKRGDCMDEKRLESLKVAISSIEKRFGKGSLMKLGEHETVKIDVIPTSSLSIDYAIGVCGIPRGRVTEIYGPESSGKTTLALHCVANAQKEGGIAAFVDAEHALDIEYAKNLGVDVDNLLISQPDSGEQALEIIDTLVRSNAVDIIVLDSVAALVPQAEIEGDMGDAHMGLQARLMSQALRKLTGAISKTNTAIIFLNQIRSKIGVMFGNPETTTGGNALKFYASVRIDIRKINNIKQGQDIVGNRTKVKIVKNKVAPPFKEAEVDIIYGKGIDYIGDALDLAVNHDIIEKSGSWFAYQNQRLGQGRDNARDFLKDNPELLKTLIDEIKAKLNCYTQKKEDGTD
jgi:recombination protein RecA